VKQRGQSRSPGGDVAKAVAEQHTVPKTHHPGAVIRDRVEGAAHSPTPNSSRVPGPGPRGGRRIPFLPAQKPCSEGGDFAISQGPPGGESTGSAQQLRRQKVRVPSPHVHDREPCHGDRRKVTCEQGFPDPHIGVGRKRQSAIRHGPKTINQNTAHQGELMGNGASRDRQCSPGLQLSCARVASSCPAHRTLLCAERQTACLPSHRIIPVVLLSSL